MSAAADVPHPLWGSRSKTCRSTHKPPRFAVAVTCERGRDHAGEHEAFCDDCNGVGFFGGVRSAQCKACNGKGVIRW
jgi:DnaJ-class molecular chaperone